MLVNLNQVLPSARKGKYAVPAFDSTENVFFESELGCCTRDAISGYPAIS